MYQHVSWTFKGVKWLHGQVEKSNDEKLEAVKDAEGCPHIDLIKGFTQPFNEMISHLAKNGGIAWQTDDNNQWWYWHPQEDFRPLLGVKRAHRGRKLRRIDPPIGGQNCKWCVAAIRARSEQ
jgi:hypothetical protein